MAYDTVREFVMNLQDAASRAGIIQFCFRPHEDVRGRREGLHMGNRGRKERKPNLSF